MAGLEISEAGVLICKDYSGRPSGEAYVEILNEDHFEAAVEKHNENMGHRWGHPELHNTNGLTVSSQPNVAKKAGL